MIELLPKNAKLNCKNCHFVSGTLLEPCQDCEKNLFGCCDSDSDEPVKIKVPKRYQKLTPEEIRRKEERKQLQEEHRLANIKRREEEIIARREAFMANLLNTNVAVFMDAGRIATNPEFRIINQIIQTNINRGLAHFNRFYPEDLVGEFTRGPANIRDIREYIGYNKPKGFIGIALDVPEGQWLSNNGGNNEWMVAYHGTGLQATQSILRQGLIPGPGQSFRHRINRNPLSAPGEIGVGVFCTPDLPEAINHNRANSVVCILQCRVNPRALKIADNINWVVNQTVDIRPYRLLLKLL